MARWFIARIERFCIPLTLLWYILTLDTARDAVWSIRNISTYIPPSVSNRNFATAQGQPRPHLIPDLRRQCCNESWWNSLKRAVWQPSSRKYDVTQFARLIPACVRYYLFLDVSLKTFPPDILGRARYTLRVVGVNKASSARDILFRSLVFSASFPSLRCPSCPYVFPPRYRFLPRRQHFPDSLSAENSRQKSNTPCACNGHRMRRAFTYLPFTRESPEGAITPCPICPRRVVIQS